jgi:hypothetical protein
MPDETPIEHETLTWDGFGQATRDLSRRIVAAGFVPEVVVAIARGGLLPAGALAYGLGVKNCGSLNVEFYTGIGTVLDVPEVLPPDLDIGYLRRRHRPHAATRRRPARRARCRRALRDHLHEADDDRRTRLLVEAHRTLDRLPVVVPRFGRRRGCRLRHPLRVIARHTAKPRRS